MPLGVNESTLQPFRERQDASPSVSVYPDECKPLDSLRLERDLLRTTAPFRVWVNHLQRKSYARLRALDATRLARRCLNFRSAVGDCRGYPTKEKNGLTPELMADRQLISRGNRI